MIFGATGDLAKLVTFPALVGLVQRGVLNVPVIGVAKSAIRDVVQNHMLQVLATVLADPPDGPDLASWRDAKSRLEPVRGPGQ